MHKQYVVILETGETRLHFFPPSICVINEFGRGIWANTVAWHVCVVQLNNRSRGKTTVAWGLSFISVELGDRKPGTKQMRTVLYLQVVLPVQSGLSLIRRSPVSPDLAESKVGISSLWAFLGKFWLCQGQGQNNFKGFGNKNPNMW